MNDIHWGSERVFFSKGYEDTDLLVEDILARDIRGDVTSDGVSNSIGTVGVKLSSGISFRLQVSTSIHDMAVYVQCSWRYHPRNRGSGRSKGS